MCSAEDLIIDGGCDDAGFSDGEQCVRAWDARRVLMLPIVQRTRKKYYARTLTVYLVRM